MNIPKKLKTTTDIVKYILQNHPQARNSDNVLYLRVLGVLGKQKGIDLNFMSVPTFFMHLNDYGFPSLETVGRVRRKVVETHPELAGNSTVEAHRILNEEAFRDYARQVNV